MFEQLTNVWVNLFIPIFRSFLRAQKVLKFELMIKAIIIFVKNIKKASIGGLCSL